jgi:hypothetical protein
LINAETCGNAGEESHEALSVGFSGSVVAQHVRLVSGYPADIKTFDCS